MRQGARAAIQSLNSTTQHTHTHTQVRKIFDAQAYQPTTGRNMGVSKLPGGLEGGGIEDDIGTYWESTQDNHGICEQKRHLPEMCRIQTIS